MRNKRHIPLSHQNKAMMLFALSIAYLFALGITSFAWPVIIIGLVLLVVGGFYVGHQADKQV